MNESSTAGPWLAVAYVFTLVLAGTLNRSSEPVSLRPVEEGTVIDHSLIATRVPARLWEDPIAAGWRAMNASDPNTRQQKLWHLWESASTVLSDRAQTEFTPEEIRRLSWLEQRETIKSANPFDPMDQTDPGGGSNRTPDELRPSGFLDSGGELTKALLSKVEQLAVLKAITLDKVKI